MRRATISLFDRKMPRDLALAFGRFEFRSRTRKLLKDGVPCRIGFKAYRVLHVLLAHRDRVVTLDELLDKVWPNQSVETNNLQVQIWTIRNLIGKEKIVNVARVGYQFVAPTRELFERVAGDGRSLHDPLGSLCTPVCIDEPWEGAHSDRPRLRWRSLEFEFEFEFEHGSNLTRAYAVLPSLAASVHRFLPWLCATIRA